MKWPFVRRDTFVRSEKEAESWREIAQERGNKLIGAQVEADRHLAALNLSAASNARLRDQNVLLNARALRAEGLVEKVEAVALAEERRVEIVQTMFERRLEIVQAMFDRADADRANAEARVAEALARFDQLLVKFTDLRLAGASLPEPPPERVPRAEPDVVTQAMIARGRGSPVLMKQFAEYVTERRAENVTDAVIAAEILAGVEDNEGIPA